MLSYVLTSYDSNDNRCRKPFFKHLYFYTEILFIPLPLLYQKFRNKLSDFSVAQILADLKCIEKYLLHLETLDKNNSKNA